MTGPQQILANERGPSATVDATTTAETRTLRCIGCGREFEPIEVVAWFDGSGRSAQWGESYRDLRAGPLCLTCYAPGHQTLRDRGEELHDVWERRERAIAEWQDPDDWTARPTDERYGKPATDEEARACLRDDMRKYIPPGSRGRSAKSKRFGAKGAQGKRQEAEPWTA